MKMTVSVNDDNTTIIKDGKVFNLNTKELHQHLYELETKIDLENFKEENKIFIDQPRVAIKHILNLSVKDLLDNKFFQMTVKEIRYLKKYENNKVYELFVDYCNNSYFVLKIIYKHLKECRNIETNDVINIMSIFGVIYPNYYLYDYNTLFIDVFERDYNTMIEKLVGDYLRIRNIINEIEKGIA